MKKSVKVKEEFNRDFAKLLKKYGAMIDINMPKYTYDDFYVSIYIPEKKGKNGKCVREHAYVELARFVN